MLNAANPKLVGGAARRQIHLFDVLVIELLGWDVPPST